MKTETELHEEREKAAREGHYKHQRLRAEKMDRRSVMRNIRGAAAMALDEDVLFDDALGRIIELAEKGRALLGQEQKG